MVICWFWGDILERILPHERDCRLSNLNWDKIIQRWNSVFSCAHQFYCIHNENNWNDYNNFRSCLCCVFWFSFSRSCFEWNDLQCAQNFNLSAMLLSPCCCHGIFSRTAHPDYFDFGDILHSRVYLFLALWKILYLTLLDFIDGYKSCRSIRSGFDGISF